MHMKTDHWKRSILLFLKGSFEILLCHDIIGFTKFTFLLHQVLKSYYAGIATKCWSSLAHTNKHK